MERSKAAGLPLIHQLSSQLKCPQVSFVSHQSWPKSLPASILGSKRLS